MKHIHLDRTDGEHSRVAKLNQNIVRHLRAEFARKPADMRVMEFCRSRAALYGVKPDIIRRVVRRMSWR